MKRAIIECEACGRTYLGVVESGEVSPIAGSRCAGCRGADFSVVERPDVE